MHCPGCGTFIGSEEVSYCTRCGLTLGPVRSAMVGSIWAGDAKAGKPSARIGAGAMLAVLLPTLIMLAVTSASMLPAAFGIVTAGLAAICAGAKPLLRLLKSEHGAAHAEDFAVRLQEIRFGASATYLTAVLSTLLIAAAVPDSLVPAALLTLVPGLCLLAFALSGRLIQRSRHLFGAKPAALNAGNDTPRAALESAPTTRQLEYQPPLARNIETARDPAYAKHVPGVTEDTTRNLN